MLQFFTILLLSKRVSLSVCRKCVLMFDHHCPYLYTCVGYRNRPYFATFIFAGTNFTFLSCYYFSLSLSFFLPPRPISLCVCLSLSLVYLFILSLFVSCLSLFSSLSHLSLCPVSLSLSLSLSFSLSLYLCISYDNSHFCNTQLYLSY